MLFNSMLQLGGQKSKYMLQAPLTAPLREALFQDMTWTVKRVDNGPLSGPRTATTAIEVTCSDGIFCNGMERLLRDKCVRPTALPCVDPGGDPCASYACDEATQRCKPDPLGGVKCAKCLADACKPSCPPKGVSCADNGCGGTCGLTCTKAGDYCVAGVCQVVTQLGSCGAPEPLFGLDGVVPPEGKPLFEVFGDNT
jgi:hypothetical protein